MGIAVIGESQIIPVEFHRSLNPHLWVDLNDTVKEAKRNENFYNTLYAASPYILAACSISALAIAYFYAPAFIYMTAGGLFVGNQVCFHTVIPHLTHSYHQNHVLANDSEDYLNEERSIQTEIRSWEDVRAQFREFHISDTNAHAICNQVSTEHPHLAILRAIAIERVLKRTIVKYERKTEELQDQVNVLRHAFQNQQFLLPQREAAEKRDELVEKQEDLFRLKSLLIEQKIRAAFILTVLSRPNERRKVHDFGAVTLKSHDETVDEERMTGIRAAFVRKRSADRVEITTREWILDAALEEVAQRLFDVNGTV